MGNALLDRAAHQRPATTKRGALERLFTLMFKGFVYNQIWEDPAVDIEALRLGPQHRLITIASRNDLRPRFSVYQLGRGNDPVTVVASIFPALAFNMLTWQLPRTFTLSCKQPSTISGDSM